MLRDVYTALKSLRCIPDSQIDRAINILTEIAVSDPEEGVDKYAFNLLQSIFNQSDRDNLIVWSEVQNNLYNSLIDRIGEYGISLLHENLRVEDMPILYETLFALNSLETYPDVTHLINIIESENNVKDILIHCLIAVNDRLTDDLYEVIDNVNSSLIDSLINLFKERENETEITTANRSDVNVEEIMSNPEIQQRMSLLSQDSFKRNIPEDIQRLVGTNPFSLSIKSIIAMIGNRVADLPASEYTWLSITWLSSDLHLDKLYECWSRCFLDEIKEAETKARIDHLLTQYGMKGVVS